MATDENEIGEWNGHTDEEAEQMRANPSKIKTNPHAPIDLEKVRERHWEIPGGSLDGLCHQCTQHDSPHPCDAIQLADEIERQDAAIAEYIKIGAEQIEETARLRDDKRVASSAINKQIEVNQGLRGALEEIIIHDRSKPWYDHLTETQSKLPKWIAREALEEKA